RYLARLVLAGRPVLVEDSDLDGLRGRDQIPDHILHQLSELHVERGLAPLDLLAQLLRDRVRASAMTPAQPQDIVADIGLRDEEPQLVPGPPGPGHDLRHAPDLLLYL